MRYAATTAVTGLALLALAGCKQENVYPSTETTTTTEVPVPGPTTTVVVPVPGKETTVVVPVPGPTATVTASATPDP